MGKLNNSIMAKAEYFESLETLYNASKRIADMIIEKPWTDDEWTSLIEFKRAIEAVENAPKLVH